MEKNNNISIKENNNHSSSVSIEDIRMCRKVGLKIKNGNEFILLQQSESFVIDGKKISFTAQIISHFV